MALKAFGAKHTVAVRKGRSLQFELLSNLVNEFLQSFIVSNCELFGALFGTNKAVGVGSVFVLRNIHARLAKVVADVLQSVVAASENFYALIDTRSRNERICRCDCRDDVLDDPHRQLVVDTFYAVLGRSQLRMLAQPFHVIRTIFIDTSLEVFGPLNHVGVLDAMFWLTWDFLHRAQWVTSLGRQSTQHAFVARI